MMTAPMVDYKIHWLKMMSVPQSRAVVGRHDGINGRDRVRNGRFLAQGRRSASSLRTPRGLTTPARIRSIPLCGNVDAAGIRMPLHRFAGTIRRNKHRDDRAHGRLQNPLAQNDVRAGEPSRRWEARWNKWKGQQPAKPVAGTLKIPGFLRRTEFIEGTALRRMDRGVRLRTPDRRAPRPPHPSRQHPQDERRQLSAQPEPQASNPD